MKPISLSCLTGQIKKVIYVFHSNGNSFDMIFITIIYPKIRKRSNGFLKWICFHRFYFNLISSHFLSGHDSKKHIFSFNRFLKQPFFLSIFLEAAGRSFKNIMFAEAATHLPQHKKYQLHIFFHGFCTKIYSEAAAQIFTVSAQNVLKIFHNIFDGQC